MNIERLGTGEGERLRSIRLRALQDSPGAFSTTYDQAASWPPEKWEQQLEQLATFVATVDGVDLGMVRGAAHEYLQDTGELVSMWVAPEARARGIGSGLIDAVEVWARDRGFSRLLLDVVETELPALSLYERKGFTRTGEVGSMPPPREQVREIQMVEEL